MEQKEVLSCSEFWTDSKTALETGLFDKFWDLSVEWRAWLIATIEARDILQRARDYVDAKEREHDNKPKKPRK